MDEGTGIKQQALLFSVFQLNLYLVTETFSEYLLQLPTYPDRFFSFFITHPPFFKTIKCSENRQDHIKDTEQKMHSKVEKRHNLLFEELFVRGKHFNVNFSRIFRTCYQLAGFCFVVHFLLLLLPLFSDVFKILDPKKAQ